MKRRKKMSRKKKIIIGIIAVLVIIGMAVFFFLRWRARSNMPDMLSRSDAQETIAVKGNISNTIVGTGNLEMDTAVSIKIPSGLTIEKIYVENGDHVSTGDILAVADTVSVLEAMEDVQEKLDTLDEQLVEAQEGSDAETICATIEGTVKKVYAEEDEDVISCMQEHGAIMVILDENGKKIKITRTSGTIEDIYVSAGDTVEVGDSLFTLAAEDISSEYSTLLAKREALTDTMETLLALSEDNSIKAQMDGTIQSINIEEGDDENTSSSGNQSGGAVNMSYSTGSIKMLNTKYQSSKAGTLVYVSSEADAGDTELDEAREALQILLAETELLNEEDYSAESWKLFQEAIANAKESASKETVTADELTAAMQEISAAMEALVSAEPKETVTVTVTPTATLTATPTATPTVPPTATPTATPKSTKKATVMPTPKSNKKNTAAVTPTPSQSANDGGSSWSSSAGSGSASIQSSQSDDSEEESQNNSDEGDTVSQYSTDITAFTVAGDEQMILSVNVDELDINQVSEGQEAEITFDAIEDEVFTGSVTKIGSTASASGGVAKYSVEITIPKSDEMKVGMNASATIVIEEKSDIITIPVDALQERGNEVFVYTGKDEEGNLSGEQTVETGLSDGDTVEIVSGLSEGTTVYYQKTGSAGSSSDSMEKGERGGFPDGGSDSGFGGGMPGGGSDNGFKGGGMPGGGGPGM